MGRYERPTTCYPERMTAYARRLPDLMTVDEFLAWRGGDGTGRVYELVEGEIRAQDHASDAHGTVQARIALMLGNHLDRTRPNCRVVTAPGVRPHIRSDWNYRVPEIAVTCAPNRADVRETPDPILIVEVLSPSNRQDTWGNVNLIASLTSVVEILVVESEEIGAHLLRRLSDGSWPANPLLIGAEGEVRLESVDLTFALSDAYRGTHLAR